MIPASQYVPREATTVNSKMEFAVSGYFSDLAEIEAPVRT